MGPAIKSPVADSAVDEFVARIRAGGPLGKLFPGKLSECDFTATQREKIRKARAEKKALQRNGGSTLIPSQPQPNSKSTPLAQTKTSKALNKLRKMLYLQRGSCFFCGMPLKDEDASIEHLNPKSRGGTSTEDNEVVCHKTLNHAFGNMDLKRKFEFMLKAKGAFHCPGT
jgi:5-methylcytosine-specific restriction endonuclease McrA